MYPQVLIPGLLLLLPAAVDSFPEVSGVVGHSVTLPCSYPVSDGISYVCWGRGECGDTCGQTLIWTNGHRVYYRTDRRYQLKGQLLQGDVSLTIENATERDSGLYCCRVEMKGWNGVQSLTASLQVQPEVPTTSSRRVIRRFKPINRPRTTPRKTRTTPRKLITTPRKPTVTTRRLSTTPKRTTTTRRPTTTPKPTTTPRRPTTTTKPTTTTRRPTTTTKPTTTTRRPTTTTKPTTTTRRPSTTTKPTTTTRRPSTTTKPTTTTRRPSTTTRRPTNTTNPTTTARRPSTTTKPTVTTRRPSETTKPTTTTRRASDTTKPTTITRRSSTTTKPTVTTRRPTNTPKSTRISPSTSPLPVDAQTLKPVYTETVTSSHRPWNKHTEEVPTPHPVTIPTKGLYIGISVSVGLLLLTGVLMILKCRHMRKKRKPEISVVFHAYQNETFQSSVHPQTEDKFDITDDNSHSRSKP